MKAKTDDEILTHYVLSQGMDPDNDEVRKVWKETLGFAGYNAGVRTEELKQAIKEGMQKIYIAYIKQIINKL